MKVTRTLTAIYTTIALCGLSAAQVASTVNYSNTTPAAPSGAANVNWQNDGGSPTVNLSAYLPSSACNAPFTCLNGTGYVFMNGQTPEYLPGRFESSPTYNLMVGSSNSTITSAIGNICIGGNDCAALTSGSYNYVVGHGVLQVATTGSANDGIGDNIFGGLTTGSGNSAVGDAQLTNVTTGSDNAALGHGDCNSLVSGNDNICIGSNALYADLTGNQNTAIGYEALTGELGSGAIGIGAGACGAATGLNECYGTSSGSSLTTGLNNWVAGYHAGSTISTASNNVIVGNQAANNATGSNNVYIGYDAANGAYTGSGNVLIGYGAYMASTGLSDATCIGNLCAPTKSDQVMLGGPNNTAVAVYGILMPAVVNGSGGTPLAACSSTWAGGIATVADAVSLTAGTVYV